MEGPHVENILVLAKTELASLVWAPASACFPGAPAVIWVSLGLFASSPGGLPVAVGKRRWGQEMTLACGHQASRVRYSGDARALCQQCLGRLLGSRSPPRSDSRLGAGCWAQGEFIRRSPPRTPGSGILEPASCRWWGRAKRPRNPQIDATYLTEGNSTLEQQWAGSTFLPVSTGFSICQKAWAPSGGSHPSSCGEPLLPRPLLWIHPSAPRRKLFFSPLTYSRAALYRGGTLSSSNTKTYFSTDSVCAKELWRLTTAYKDTYPRATGETYK